MNIANLLKTNSKLIFWTILLILTLFLFSNYSEGQAKQKAQMFCSSIQINESLLSLLNKCAAAQAQ